MIPSQEVVFRIPTGSKPPIEAFCGGQFGRKGVFASESTMSKEIMNAEEVAEYLGIAQSTAYKWVEYRQIPFTKIGTLLRFPKWIIDRWLSEKAVRPERSLFDEFERLNQRYHLEQFLKAKGLDVDRMTEVQLVAELTKAIQEIKAEGGQG